MVASKHSGDAQSGLVNASLPDSIVVEMTNISDGSPAPGLDVSYDGSGSASPDPSTTNSSGFAASEWTLGPEAGEQTILAQTPAGELEFSATATNPDLNNVEISPKEFEFFGDYPEEFTAMAFDTSSYMISQVQANFNWSSVDPAIATVDSDGWVTPISEGFTEIIAEVQGVSDTASVTVSGNPLASGILYFREGEGPTGCLGDVGFPLSAVPPTSATLHDVPDEGDPLRFSIHPNPNDPEGTTVQGGYWELEINVRSGTGGGPQNRIGYTFYQVSDCGNPNEIDSGEIDIGKHTTYETYTQEFTSGDLAWYPGALIYVELWDANGNQDKSFSTMDSSLSFPDLR